MFRIKKCSEQKKKVKAVPSIVVDVPVVPVVVSEETVSEEAVTDDFSRFSFRDLICFFHSTLTSPSLC
jgi:hypothetical protein